MQQPISLTFYEKHRDPELVRRIGAATALEVRATGIPYVFAPCIAVNNIQVYCVYQIFGLYLKFSKFLELFYTKLHDLLETISVGLSRPKMGSLL